MAIALITFCFERDLEEITRPIISLLGKILKLRFGCDATVKKEGGQYVLMTDDSVANPYLLKRAFNETVKSVMIRMASAYDWRYEGTVEPFRPVPGLVTGLAHSVMRNIFSPQVFGSRVEFESNEYALRIGGPLNLSPNGSSEFFCGQVIGVDYERGIPVAILRTSPAVTRTFLVTDSNWIDMQFGRRTIVQVKRFHGGRRCWMMQRHYTYSQLFESGDMVAISSSRHAKRGSASRQEKWRQGDLFG